MLPDRVSNPGPLTYESGALPIALRGPAPNTNEPKLSSTDKIWLFSMNIGAYLYEWIVGEFLYLLR